MFLGEDHVFASFLKQSPITKVAFVDLRMALFRYSKDSDWGWEPVPGARAGIIHINSQGFRGHEYLLKPRQDIWRVAVIGDSETFGRLLREEYTFPGYLQTELNKNLSGMKFEVLYC